MDINDLKNIKTLIAFKCDVPCSTEALKMLKEDVDTEDVSSYAKKLYSVLKLETVFKELGLDEPDFSYFENDKSVNEVRYTPDMFKW